MPAAAFLASLLSTFRFFAAAAAAYRRSHFWLTATTTTRLSRELLWSTKSVCCCWRQESLARAEGDFCARSKSRRVKNNRQTANERETQPNFAQKTINYSFLSRSPIDIHNSHKVDTHTYTRNTRLRARKFWAQQQLEVCWCTKVCGFYQCSCVGKNCELGEKSEKCVRREERSSSGFCRALVCSHLVLTLWVSASLINAFCVCARFARALEQKVSASNSLSSSSLCRSHRQRRRRR